MSRQTDAPFLILAWRRPEHLSRCLTQLKEAGATRVYVNVDGPRSSSPSDFPAVKMCQEIVRTRSRDFKVFKHRFLEQNEGLNVGVGAAIKWFLDSSEVGFILEDDVLIDPRSIYLASQLLDSLKNEHVGSVSLFNVVPSRRISQPWLATRFSRWPSSQYWATSRARWAAVPEQIQDWRAFISSQQLNRVGGKQFARYWERALDAAVAQDCITWEHRWLLTNWVNDWLALVTNSNHAINIGFDDQASSIKRKPRYFPTDYGQVSSEMTTPLCPTADVKADAWSIRQGLGLGAQKAIRRWLRTRASSARRAVKTLKPGRSE